MAVQCQCPNPACGQMLSFADENAGRQALCPKCNTKFTIPPAPAPVAIVPRPVAVAGNAPGIVSRLRDPKENVAWGLLLAAAIISMLVIALWIFSPALLALTQGSVTGFACSLSVPLLII